MLTKFKSFVNFEFVPKGGRPGFVVLDETIEEKIERFSRATFPRMYYSEIVREINRRLQYHLITDVYMSIFFIYIVHVQHT